MSKRIQDNHRKHTRQCEHMQWFCADSLDEHLIPRASFGCSCLIPSFLHSNEVFVGSHTLQLCVFHVVSGSGSPSLALPDDLFLLRLETCSHSFFTYVFFVLFLRTTLRLTSVSTALLSRHSPKCHISVLSLKSPRVITMVTPRQPKNTDLIEHILVWP